MCREKAGVQLRLSPHLCDILCWSGPVGTVAPDGGGSTEGASHARAHAVWSLDEMTSEVSSGFSTFWTLGKGTVTDFPEA